MNKYCGFAPKCDKESMAVTSSKVDRMEKILHVIRGEGPT